MNSYGPMRGGRDRVPSSPQRVVVPEPESPAAISTVQEIVEAVTERLLESSTTRLRRETRPLKLSVAGLGALVLATCGWGFGQVQSWKEDQREQWETELRRAEQDEAIAAHLAEPHVEPEDLQGLKDELAGVKTELGKVTRKLDEMSKDDEAKSFKPRR